MKKTKVTLENYEKVYAESAQHFQNRTLSRVGYAAMSAIYHPNVHYAPSAKAQLDETVKRHIPLVVAINHVSESDPFITSAAAWRSPLRPLLGRDIRVLAKDSLFIHPVMRWGVELMGSTPVFRKKNYPGQDRLLAQAGNTMLQTVASRMINTNGSLAIYVEGTCNKVDPLLVQQVQPGVGRITKQLHDAEDFDFSFLPVGLYLGNDASQTKSATVYIGNTIPGAEVPYKPSDVVPFTHALLQNAVDIAKDI